MPRCTSTATHEAAIERPLAFEDTMTAKKHCPHVKDPGIRAELQAAEQAGNLSDDLLCRALGVMPGTPEYRKEVGACCLPQRSRWCALEFAVLPSRWPSWTERNADKLKAFMNDDGTDDANGGEPARGWTWRRSGARERWAF